MISSGDELRIQLSYLNNAVVQAHSALDNLQILVEEISDRAGPLSESNNSVARNLQITSLRLEPACTAMRYTLQSISRDLQVYRMHVT
jgi:hypothetical protein